MLKLPLLDSSLLPSQLAAWIDAHTMAGHHDLLQCLDQVLPTRLPHGVLWWPSSRAHHHQWRCPLLAATSSPAQQAVCR